MIGFGSLKTLKPTQPLRLQDQTKNTGDKRPLQMATPLLQWKMPRVHPRRRKLLLHKKQIPVIIRRKMCARRQTITRKSNVPQNVIGKCVLYLLLF
jgi:hypothetical protein